MQTAPERLDALAALALTGHDARVALISRVTGAVIQPDTAGHDDHALLAAEGVAAAPMSVGRLSAAPDAGTLEVTVPDGPGPSEQQAVDVRLETSEGLWSAGATIHAATAAPQPGHRQLTVALDGPLVARARRSQFRYPLPPGVDVTAVLWPMAEPAVTHTDEDAPFDPRPITPLAMRGRTVEIGGGGLATVFPAEALQWTEWFERFMVGISAPDDPRRAVLQTTVRIASRHAISGGERAEHRLGLEFEVARRPLGTRHAYIYVEVMKLIESIQAAARRAA